MSEQIRRILKEEITPLRDELKTEIRKVRTLLDGNGTPEKGLLIRVDRIEQTHKSNKYWIRTMAVLVVTSLLSSLRTMFI